MENEIVIRNLQKQYRSGTQALKGIDLSIEKGQFFTLLGPNGAGKSTLVKILTTLIIQDNGEYFISGMSPVNDFKKIQHYIGVASQDNEIDPSETPENLLIFQGRLFGMSKIEAKKRANELIQLFFLEKEKDKKSETLSGGNKRRLHCALSLVHKPQLLFLDEPTVGMDPLARSNFWDVISALNSNEGVTVFLTTQYLDEADKYASQMALIVEGNIHYSGSVSGFKTMVHPESNISLEDSYLKYIKKFTMNKNVIMEGLTYEQCK